MNELAKIFNILEIDTQAVLDFITKQDWHNKVLLMMSSGNFDGIDYDALGAQLCASL